MSDVGKPVRKTKKERERQHRNTEKEEETRRRRQTSELGNTDHRRSDEI